MFCFAELYNPSVFSESQESLVKHSLRQQLNINRYDSSIFIADMDKTRCIILLNDRCATQVLLYCSRSICRYFYYADNACGVMKHT